MSITGDLPFRVRQPGLVRNRFRHRCQSHEPALAKAIVDSASADQPTDGQLVAMAHGYLRRFDAMAADPSTA